MEEISAKELRIGNLVYLTNTGLREQKVIPLEHYDFEHIVHKRKVFRFEPIPLTEQWLIDLGFEGQISEFYKNKLTITLKDSDKSHLKGRVYFNSWAILENQPEYVHQLQNLYFALTGKELDLKTKTL